MKTPLVSVCVLTYNRAHDLQNTIKSYLNQTYSNSELVVIDDASPDNTASVMKKWTKKSSKIRYVKNEVNLGLSANFNSSFNHCRGKYIIFIGDDDLFMDNSALEWYVKAFSRKSVGLVRSRQILFRKGKLFQAVPKSKSNEIDVYIAGIDSINNFLFDSISIAGLGYKNSLRIKKMFSNNPTMYPQFELVAKMCLFYSSAQINRYLIGVQSHEGQLNVISYKLGAIQTNILDDMSGIFKRMKAVANRNNIRTINNKKLMKTLVEILPLFLPYNTLKNGKLNTFKFIEIMKKNYPEITRQPLFWVSFLFILLPSPIIKVTLKTTNAVRLRKMFSENEISSFNKKLDEFFLR